MKVHVVLGDSNARGVTPARHGLKESFALMVVQALSRVATLGFPFCGRPGTKRAGPAPYD